MNLITHEWNGSAIAQLSEVTKIAKHDVPAGYVNVTQMCKACNKLWADYTRLDSTKEFLEKFSGLMGIPIDLLIISNTKGKNEQRGTWTHPEIAIDCAQWVNIDFRIWAIKTLRKVMSGEPVIEAPSPSPTPVLPTPTLEQISDLIDLTLGKAGIDPKLLAGVKLNTIAKQFPSLKAAAEEALAALVVPIESRLLTPTKVGEILKDRTGEKWGAQRVNKILIEKGFQVVNPDEDGDPDYLPTEKGKQYSGMTYATAKGHGKTVQHLRWYESVVEAILEETNGKEAP